jgi:hypothetical protein
VKPSLIIIIALVTILAWLGLGQPKALALSSEEVARVDKFLVALGQEKELVFIRNGREFEVTRAVNHLKRKLKSQANKLATAEEFIDHIASSSSISGKPYLIRRPGGQNEEAKPYFQELLKKSTAETS